MRARRPLSALLGALVCILGSLSSQTASAAPIGIGDLQVVSVSDSAPATMGESDSSDPSISDDGRYVVFASGSTNLTGAPAGRSQIYLRDTITGRTTLVSRTPAGVAGDGDSRSPKISGDGSRVVYVSDALNLNTSGIPQVLAWARATGVTRIVSVDNSSPPNRANAPASAPAISFSGARVVFVSRATNLTGSDSRGASQVYSREIDTNFTMLVSSDLTGSGDQGGDADATSPAISALGTEIAFVTKSRLTADSPAPNGKTQVYVRGARLANVSVDRAGSTAADQDASAPALSADGAVVAFVSRASNLTPEANGGRQQVYVRSIVNGRTILGSYGTTDGMSTKDEFAQPSLSVDGAKVAYYSSAGQVFVRELPTGRTVIASRNNSDVSGDAPSLQSAITTDARYVVFASRASNLTAGSTGAQQIYVRNLVPRPHVERLGGVDRFEVAAAVAGSAFPPRVDVAYVASGSTFADSLSGSVAAGCARAPVLLVTRDTIPTATSAALRRLSPARIVVLGGPNTIGAAVEAGLSAYSPSVTRIGGADRFEVSAAISAATFPPGGRVVVASGTVFPDALSGSALAGNYPQGPVLLVTKDAVPAAVMTELERLQPAQIVVVGGTDTISDATFATLAAQAPATRIGGADRYAVSGAIAGFDFPKTGRTAYVASGEVFPDALSGSAAAIVDGAPVVLVTPGAVPAAAAAELRRLKPSRIVILGGPNSVSVSVETALQEYLGPMM